MEEPKIRYFLEPNRGKVKTKRTIMAEVNYRYAVISRNGKKSYKPFRISLKKSIKPEQFGIEDDNFKHDEAIFSKSQRNNSTIRRAMNKLEDAIDEVYKEYDRKGEIPNPREFKEQVEIQLGRKASIIQEQPTILEYLYSRIDKDEENLRRGVQKKRKKSTIKTYNTLARDLENYHLATGNSLRFETFTNDTFWNFFDILDDILKGKYNIQNPNQPRKQIVKEYGFLKNSLRKKQTSFLSLFKEALEKGITSDFNPNQKSLLVERSESSKDLYIKENELQSIIEANVSHDTALLNAKEYILIASLTASRNETMNDLHKEAIQTYVSDEISFDYFHSKHNKTGTECFIPILKPIAEIIKNHNGTFPKFYANANINSNLKELFEVIGLEREITIKSDTYRNGLFKEKKKLFEAISTHDAKKTFTSILANYQIPENIVSNVTHPDKPSKNRMFDTYNKQTMLDKAKQFAKEINKINSDIFKL
ncbi:hypothetical protein BST92_08195 [Nonlabens arenilitoris]|uniref:Phage integrase SAM-like domain-containing protein n=1 Tax=Nonlabens arenilitoris TaxID=1217969 RepID=A0A2S7UB97_9FLAO|nr:hypothetical protein [Nonlabens arenilitoris]PQJ31907.1 hypothetical protein BST92_08195 [Nonlabens arenilitoris]